MMTKSKIIRRPDFAGGGITAEEKAAMDLHAEMWIERIMRTDPIEPDKIVPAIKALYAAADLKEPRVVIVPSPFVMALASGFAAAIWYWRKNNNIDLRATDAATYAATRAATRDVTRAATRAATDDTTRAATYDATDAATDDATYDATDDATYAATDDATLAATLAATDAATRAATDDATYDATDAATYDATRAATDAATRVATDAATDDATLAAMRAATDATTRAATDDANNELVSFMLPCAREWWRIRQGGNMWAQYDCYLTATRDILGLQLPEHKKYAAWEQCAIHGGFRVVHDEFCIVSDFPEFIRTDAENRPHCETGPSHRWRDGWSIYSWHGVQVPPHWIEDTDNVDPAEILREENVEKRAAGAEIVGWPRMIKHLDCKIIDGDPDSDMGALVELTLPGLDEPGRFLQAKCPRNGTIIEGVPRDSDIDGKPINTALAAQAWRDGLAADDYSHAPIRT